MKFETVVDFAKAQGGYWYLASPYSKYPGGMEMAFAHISKIAAQFLQAGVPIFCPIAHSHPLAEFGKMEKADHDVWLPLDEHMMQGAKGIIVAAMPGWEESYGVNWEIGFFTERHRTVLLADMPSWIEEEVTMYAPPELDESVISADEAATLCGKMVDSAYSSIADTNAVLRNAQHTPTDSKSRKNHPVTTGVLDYFPDALMAVAAVSKAGNDQHNPGQPLHWERGLSTDHADCLLRHLVDRGMNDVDGQPHSAKVAWRALALLQEEIEESLPRGAYSSLYTEGEVRSNAKMSAAVGHLATGETQLDAKMSAAVGHLATGETQLDAKMSAALKDIRTKSTK